MGKNTGGPAFPELGNVAYQSDWQNESGMTLRDYFAAASLPLAAVGSNGENLGAWQEDVAGIATRAYGLADAMLKAREA